MVVWDSFSWLCIDVERQNAEYMAVLTAPDAQGLTAAIFVSVHAIVVDNSQVTQ